MTVYPIQATFTRGQLTRELHARTDIDHYRQGLRLCTNWLVLRHGGLTRRPGTLYAGPAKNANKTAALLPFVFSDTQAYVLEFGDLYVRFWTNGGRVELTGSPYEIVSPYGEADLANIQIAQSGDAVYIACEGYHPRKLKRLGETSWTIEKVEFKDGPYLKEDPQGTTITPAETGAVHPVMASNTTPSGVASDSAGHADAWKVFDGDLSETPTGITGKSGSYTYMFDTGATRVADAYWMVSHDTTLNGTPTVWEFQGHDGTDWVTLDTRNGETGWGLGERRFFEFVNKTAYEGYRLAWTSNDGSSYSVLAEIGIHEAGDNQTPFNLTASGVAGINGGVGFLASDVGRSIRLYGSDGYWRWGRITARASATVISVRLYGHSLQYTKPIARWKLSAFADNTGYPRAVGFFKERLCWGGTHDAPRTVWGSRSANYEDEGQQSPLVDDDAIELTMTGGQLNLVQWISEGEDLLIGCSGSMRTIGQATTNAAFSATNADQKVQSHVGAARIPPVMIQRVAVFADRYRTRLHEYGPDPSSVSGGYATPELTILSADLFETGIRRLALQSSPHNLIWSVMGDGSCISTTYEKAQQIVGCTRQTITDGVVESCAVIPSEKGDQIWFLVRRIINGSTVRQIEYLSSPYNEVITPLDDCVYADASLQYDGAAASTFSGLGHLEGKTVGLLADGVDIGDATVSSGSITLPYGRTASKLTAGLRITSRAETLRLPSAGNQDGSGLGRNKRISEIMVDILDTAGLDTGTPSRVDPLRIATSSGDQSAGPLRTGAHRMFPTDSWRNGGVAVLQSTSMYPATIRAVILGVEGEP